MPNRYSKDKADYQGPRYSGLDTHGGPEAPSATAKRYRENDSGVDAGYGDIKDKMPGQSVGSLEKSLPNENPESLLNEANRAAKRSGDDSIL